MRLRSLALGASVFSLAATAVTPAVAQCAPDPTIANGITNCSGTDADGLTVTTTNTSVTVATGALVTASATPAVTIDVPAMFYSSIPTRISVSGQVEGKGTSGIALYNGQNDGSYLFGPSSILSLTVASGGSVGGINAVTLAQSKGNTSGQAIASIENSGTLSGTSGIALLATDPTVGGFSTIINHSGGVIGAISGPVGTLVNAGIIDGGANSAVAARPDYDSFVNYGQWTNKGTITSTAITATLLNPSYGGNLVNSGTISNTGSGAAIQGVYLNVRNEAGGQIVASGGTALSATNGITLTNLGTIVGNVITLGPSVIDSSLGTISGNLTLGAGDDVVIAHYAGNPTLDTGISGTIDGGGGINTIRIVATQNVAINTAVTLPNGFQRIAFAPAEGKTIALNNGFVAPQTIILGGSGSIVNNAALTFREQAFVQDFGSYPGVSSFTNNGSITTTSGVVGSPAISLFFVPTFTNTGTINVVGDGVSAGINGTFTNTGTIVATGTAVSVFDGIFDNSGTVISTGGIGVALSGNVGIPASNSGLIEGATAGVSTSIDLTNTGTIVATSAGGTAVALDAYGSLINAAGGVVGNGNGGAAVTASIFNSTVTNAGTINGAVTLENVFSGAGQRYIALPGGILNGDLTLGAGDLLVTDLVNTGPGAFAGITGSVNAGSGALLRYRVSGDATASLGAVGPFQIAGYELANGATLALTAPGTITQQVQLAGTGTVNLDASISVSTTPAILSTSVTAIPGSAVSTSPQLDITSVGTITIARAADAYAGAAVYLGSNDSFTNLGTIDIIDRQSYSPTAAIAGGANVTNGGSILLDGGIGVNYSAALVNTGTIMQVAGGATAQGVVNVGSIDNRGTISVGGTAVQLGNYSYTGVAATLANAGNIASVNGVAITGSGTISNLAGGTITGGAGTAIQLSDSALVNAGAISGTVDLGYGGIYYGGGSYRSSFSSVYVAAGGTIAGDLLFGDGNDVFLQTGATSGVSGRIVGGAGDNIYGWSLAQSGTVALDNVTATNFADRLVEVTGPSSVATITANAPFAGNLYMSGDGSIDNQATIAGSVQFGTPYIPVAPLYSGASALATFVNDGTLGGLSGSVGSFTNNGVVTADAPSYPIISLNNMGSLTFVNTGQIIGRLPRFFAVILAGQDEISVANSGSIAGELFMQAAFVSADRPGSASLSNSGTIIGGALAFVDTVSGEGGALTISNTGTIAAAGTNYLTGPSGVTAFLYGEQAATGITVQNSGTISASVGETGESAEEDAIALYLGSLVPTSANIVNSASGRIVGTGPSSTGIVASGVTVNLDNSGTIAGGGGVAVDLGEGDDSVMLRTGSSITGAIVGGGGTDSATLIGSGTSTAANQTVAAFVGFDNLTVQSGYWTAPAANSSTVARTIIDSGATLELASGATGITGYSSPSFLDDGTLVVRSDDASGGSTFGSSIVTGAGGVTFTGTGIAMLDGVNSLQNSGANRIEPGATLVLTGVQGGSFVNDGTFQIGTGGTSGDFTGSIVDNGILSFARSDDARFAGALSGSGIFALQGGGRVTFGDGYSFSGTTVLNGGAMRFTAPVATTTQFDIEGAGDIDLSGTRQTIAQLAGASNAVTIAIDGGSLTIDQSTTTSFAGSLIGDGSVTKAGTGALALAGSSSYTGATTISGGLLTVDGSLASPVTIGAGGTLGGNGAVGGLSVASAGIVAPGNSIGTLHVTGNVGFASGSVYQVQVNAVGQSDQVAASGSVAVTGGTVEVLAEPGNYANLTKYTIVTATGGITGQFADATSNLAFLTPILTYSADTVSLLMARNDIHFASMARTPNQMSVANAVEALPVANPLHLAVLTQTASTAPIAFNAFSGEAQAGVATALADQSRELRNALIDRTMVSETGLGLWAQGTGSWDRSGDRRALGRLLTNDHGVIGGIDFAVGSGRLGVAGGHSEGDLSSALLATHVNVITNTIGAYGAWQRGALTARFGGSYSWHDLDSKRSIAFPGLSGIANARYAAQSDQVFGELSYAAVEGPFVLKPFVGIAHVNTTVDGFQETGTEAALGFARNSRDITFASAGLRAGGDVAVSSTLRVQPHLSASYVHGWGDVDGSGRATLAGAQTYALTGVGIGRDTLELDGGLDFVLNQGLRIGVGYNATLSQTWSSQSIRATIGLRF